MRTYVRALGWADSRSGRAGPDPRPGGHRRGAPIRRARGARHPFLRGPGQERAQPRAGSSRVPFEWTVNPYRGCSMLYLLHSGRYAGPHGRRADAADRDIRPGDRICGTVRRGAYRRYATTEVLDHWMVVKPAYRVTLENGTELVTSGDHRFLTARGWKHVTGTGCGSAAASASHAEQQADGHRRIRGRPERSADYMRGYLCGIVRGDGHLSSRPYLRSDGRRERAQPVPAGTDRLRGARRAQEYLAGSRSRDARLPFRRCARQLPRAPGDPGSVAAVRRSDPRAHRLARPCSARLVQGLPRRDLRRGGNFSSSWLRPDLQHGPGDHRLDDVLLPPARAPVRVEQAGERMWNVRIRGGLEQQLRFFHLTDPAITRKRSIEGRAVKSQSKLKVVSIEPLGVELPLYDITTGTGDFIAERCRQPQLLRPSDARVPRPQRRPRLREGDRRQGQRARGAAQGARAAVVEAARTSRWARTPTRTSGSRAATS